MGKEKLQVLKLFKEKSLIHADAVNLIDHISKAMFNNKIDIIYIPVGSLREGFLISSLFSTARVSFAPKVYDNRKNQTFEISIIDSSKYRRTYYDDSKEITCYITSLIFLPPLDVECDCYHIKMDDPKIPFVVLLRNLATLIDVKKKNVLYLGVIISKVVSKPDSYY